MSLVDYGFYSDEEKEEEEEEKQRELAAARNDHSSNGNIESQTSYHIRAADFQRGSKDSAFEGSSSPSLSSSLSIITETNKTTSLLGNTEENLQQRQKEGVIDSGISSVKRRRSNEDTSVVHLQRSPNDENKHLLSLGSQPPLSQTFETEVEEAGKEKEGKLTALSSYNAIDGHSTHSYVKTAPDLVVVTPTEEENEEDGVTDSLFATVGADATATSSSKKRSREDHSTADNGVLPSSSSTSIITTNSSGIVSSSTNTCVSQQLQHQQGKASPGNVSSSRLLQQSQQQQLSQTSAASTTTTAPQGASSTNSLGSEQAAPSSTQTAGPSPSTPLPALPPGEAPKELLRTVERLRQLRARGITVNGNIAASLDFKNPYLLEKIMKVFDIDPYCSNYPVSVFDPNNIIPWEPRAGTPFAVQLVRRFEQRRQQRREVHTSKEAKEEIPSAAAATSSDSAAGGVYGATSATTAVSGPGAGAAASAGESNPAAVAVGGCQQAAATGPAEASDAPAEGGSALRRSRFERISPPTAAAAAAAAAQQHQQHTAAPSMPVYPTAIGGLQAAAPSLMTTTAGFNANFHQAAFEAMAKAGAMASVVQQQLHQRLLSMHSALAQQQHCASIASRDASSAAALAAAAAAAAMSYRSQQQQQPALQQSQLQHNGPSAVSGTGSSNHQRPQGRTLLSPPSASAALLCGVGTASSATLMGGSSLSLQSGASVGIPVAARGSRSQDSSGGISKEDKNSKTHKQTDKSSRQQHQEETTTGAAATISAAQHRQRLSPLRRHQATSLTSTTRWGRGESTTGSTITNIPHHDARSLFDSKTDHK